MSNNNDNNNNNNKNKKKSMKVRGKNSQATKKKPNILVKLYEDKKLCSKVDNAFDMGMTLSYIAKLCSDYGLEISEPTLSRYNQKRQEAIETGYDLGDLLDKRKKSGNIIELESKETNTSKELDPNTDIPLSDNKVSNGVFQDASILDEVIMKGINTLQLVDTVDLPLVLKAIELKDKLTGGQLQGLSVKAVKELKLRQIAKENAMTQVIMEHIPESEHDKIFKALEQAEKEFYDSMDMSSEGRKLMESIELTEFNL